MNDFADHYMPGITFVRNAIAKAVAFKNGANAVAYSEKRWGRNSAAANFVKSMDIRMKAGVSGGEESSGGNWSDLVDVGAQARAFIDAVAPLTVLGKLNNLRKVPAHAPVVRSAGSAVAHWVGESKGIPLSPAAFTRFTMTPLKIGCLAVASNDLLANESPEAEALVYRDLLRAVAVLTDVSFCDHTNAGSAGVSPAAVTHGGTIVTSSNDLSDDLAQAIDAFHGDLASAAWVMSPRMAARIVFTTGGLGLGSGLGLRGGEMLGLPAIVSTATESSTDGGTIALLDPTNIVAVDEGAETSLAKSATVEMDDTVTGATDTPTSATTTHLVSLFQADASAIRVTRHINWSANSGSVVVITGADYASA